MSTSFSRQVVAVIVCLSSFVVGGIVVESSQTRRAGAEKAAGAFEYKVTESPYVIRNEKTGPSREEIFEKLQNHLNRYAAQGWEPVCPHIDSSRDFPDTSGLSGVEAIEAVANSKDWRYSLQSGDSGALILRRAR